MTRKRKFIIILSGLLLLAFILLNVFAYRHAYAMMHFASGGDRTMKPESLSLWQKVSVLMRGVSLPRPHAGDAPSGLDYQNLVINGNDGVKLGAWYLPVATPSAPLVILFHGYGGEKSGTLKEGAVFQSMGYAVLMVDFRGSGDSSEAYTTIGYLEAEDVAVAVCYGREHLNHSRIILYGQSMGAAAVLRAVHSLETKVDAIVIEAVFDRLLTTVERRFDAMGLPSFPAAQLLVFWGGRQAQFNGFKHNPVDYARAVTCPILFLHGAADPRARLEDARRVYEAVPGSKMFYEFPNLGHQSSLKKYPEAWSKTVGEFLEGLSEKSEVPPI